MAVFSTLNGTLNDLTNMEMHSSHLRLVLRKFDIFSMTLTYS